MKQIIIFISLFLITTPLKVISSDVNSRKKITLTKQELRNINVSLVEGLGRGLISYVRSNNTQAVHDLLPELDYSLEWVFSNYIERIIELINFQKLKFAQKKSFCQNSKFFIYKAGSELTTENLKYLFIKASNNRFMHKMTECDLKYLLVKVFNNHVEEENRRLLKEILHTLDIPLDEIFHIAVKTKDSSLMSKIQEHKNFKDLSDETIKKFLSSHANYDYPDLLRIIIKSSRFNDFSSEYLENKIIHDIFLDVIANYFCMIKVNDELVAHPGIISLNHAFLNAIKDNDIPAVKALLSNKEYVVYLKHNASVASDKDQLRLYNSEECFLLSKDSTLEEKLLYVNNILKEKNVLIDKEYQEHLTTVFYTFHLKNSFVAYARKNNRSEIVELLKKAF